jgi:hypothetical protein
VSGKPSRSSILLHVTITVGYLACVFLRLVCKLKLKTELLQIAHCLEQAGIDYALCGGLAGRLQDLADIEALERIQ